MTSQGPDLRRGGRDAPPGRGHAAAGDCFGARSPARLHDHGTDWNGLGSVRPPSKT